MSKKGRAQIAYRLAKVYVIQNVKRIDGHARARSLFLLFLNLLRFGGEYAKRPCQSKIERGRSGPLQAVSWHAQRASIGKRSSVIIGSGRHRVRPSGAHRERHPKPEVVGG